MALVRANSDLVCVLAFILCAGGSSRCTKADLSKSRELCSPFCDEHLEARIEGLGLVGLSLGGVRSGRLATCYQEYFVN